MLKRKIISAVLAAVMLASFAGCTKTVTTSELISAGTEGTTSVIKGTAKKTASASSEAKSTAKPKSQKNSKKGDLVVANAGKDKNADYKAKGSVTVAVDTARATDYEALFDSLKAVYKDIDIKFDYFSHSTEDSAAEYLSTRAAAGKMPDVVWDEAGKLPLYLTQGWIYPLDGFVKGDPDFKYVPKNLIKDYTFGGRLYALPHQAHYEEIFINLDVLEATNQKMPSLSWTTDDYAKYLKTAAKNKYCGQEQLFMIPTLFTSAFNANTTLYGYNPESKKFDVSGFTKAVEYTVDLRAVPNVEAWALSRTTTGGKSDYTIKFGGAPNDMSAFKKGLTLFHGVGTWEMADAKDRWSNMNWTAWTIPQNKNKKGCMPLHVDHCFMTSTCKNPKVAWQVLRYITYSTEGNLARLSMYDKQNEGKYATINPLYYPTTSSPEVAKKFNSLPHVTKTDKYLFENIGNSIRFDMAKIVPGWNDILDNTILSSVNEAMDGTSANVAAILNETANKANTEIAKQWNSFNTKLAKVQKEFDAKH